MYCKECLKKEELKKIQSDVNDIQNISDNSFDKNIINDNANDKSAAQNNSNYNKYCPICGKIIKDENKGCNFCSKDSKDDEEVAFEKSYNRFNIFLIFSFLIVIFPYLLFNFVTKFGSFSEELLAVVLLLYWIFTINGWKVLLIIGIVWKIILFIKYYNKK